MTHHWHRRTAVGIIFAIGLQVCACSVNISPKRDSYKNLRLQTSADRYISVPLEGHKYDESAAVVARKINSTRNDLIDWQKDRKVKSIEVERAIVDMVTRMQWDAAKNIDLAYRVAEKTSGPLDPGLMEKASKLAEDIDTILKTQPPDSPFVSTNISTTVDGASLHYMSVEDYNRKEEGNWNSYTGGQVMRIGRYMFRVQPPKPDQDVFKERVIIISDPTMLRLSPVIGGT